MVFILRCVFFTSQSLSCCWDDMVEDLEKGDVAETAKTFFLKSTRLPPCSTSTLTLAQVPSSHHHSLTPSLITPSLSHTITLSHHHSLTPSLITPYHTSHHHSLTPSLSHTITHHTITLSHHHSLTPSLITPSHHHTSLPPN